MRSYLNTLSSPKPKPAQSQSPLHKKKFFKFVNDNVNAKAEKSMQDQTPYEKTVKEPPKEKKDDFKKEIERRYQKSVLNHIYQFPKTDALSDSPSESSQESLDRLTTTCHYDLHSQNLRFFAKVQKRKLNKVAPSQPTMVRERTSHSLKENRKKTGDASNKNHSSEPAKNTHHQTQRETINNNLNDKNSPEYRKVLELLDENLKQVGKDSSSNTKRTEEPEARQHYPRPKAEKIAMVTGERLYSEDTPDTADTATGTRKIPTGSSPKQINFSLNVNMSNSKIIETKNVYNINNIKNVNHYHSIQDSKALSKSTKDLSAGLNQPTSTRNSKLSTQSPAAGKKIISSSLVKESHQSNTKPSTSSSTATHNTSNSKIYLKKSSAMLKSTTSNLSNTSSEKSHSSFRTSEMERFFSAKSAHDSKTPDSKSFASSRNNDEQSTSRGQSKDKLKKTATLYNKAQNDLMKKLKLTNNIHTQHAPAPIATVETPQTNGTVNIQRFLQGSLTSKNQMKTPKTPTKNIVSPRAPGGSVLMNSSSNSYLKKPDLKTTFGPSKHIGLRQTQDLPMEYSSANVLNRSLNSPAGTGPLSHLHKLIEKNATEQSIKTDLSRQKTPKAQVTPGGLSTSRNLTGRNTISEAKVVESMKLKLDLRSAHSK